MVRNGHMAITGNICQDPKVVTLPSGMKCQVFNLGFHHGNETVFIPIYLYRICKRLKKRDFIKVMGSPVICKSKDGNRLGLVCRDFVLLQEKSEKLQTSLTLK